jgi:hypothetical protein
MELSLSSARWCPVEEEFQESKILWFCGDWGRSLLGGVGEDIIVVDVEVMRLVRCRYFGASLEAGGVTLGVGESNHGLRYFGFAGLG